MNHNWQAGHEPDDIEALREQLAAAQARIAELREALGKMQGRTPIPIVTEALATPDDSSALDAALKAAYLLGFNQSGEGWNGEYPFQDQDKHPEDDANWLAIRNEELK